jgi:hypothetical protein
MTSLYESMRSSFPTYFRLALANYIDSTNKTCCFCDHVYEDVDDVINRDVVFVVKSNETIVACKKCYENRVIECLPSKNL